MTKRCTVREGRYLVPGIFKFHEDYRLHCNMGPWNLAYKFAPAPESHFSYFLVYTPSVFACLRFSQAFKYSIEHSYQEHKSRVSRTHIKSLWKKWCIGASEYAPDTVSIRARIRAAEIVPYTQRIGRTELVTGMTNTRCCFWWSDTLHLSRCLCVLDIATDTWSIGRSPRQM
jgi:hypothetical protein